MPDSSVIPCCVSPYNDQYGSVSKNTIEEIWNNEKYKLLRKQMLSGELPPGCKHCHDLENSGFASMRTSMNRRFKDDIPQIMKGTGPDGEYTEIKLKYIDIRFSNLCNLKCRGCSPSLSSSWYEDHQKLYDYKSEEPKLRSVAADSPEFWEIFKKTALDAEDIYFGGGEPLITKEHFDLLRYLISMGKTNVRLSYNTNLSTLTYGNHNLAALWEQFREVSLGVSLDDLGPRSEYFRSGSRWLSIEANLKTLKENYKKIFLHANCTVNITNVYYLPELYTYLTQNNFIGINGFNINMLLDPEELRIDILPIEAKIAVKEKIENFLKSKDFQFTIKAVNDFKNIIAHMMREDKSHLFPKFITQTKKLDIIRNESFAHVYPEFAQILKQHEKSI